MNNYTATEIAYKNGYNQALKDFSERLKAEQQYDLCGDDVVEVKDIDKIAKEMERK